MTVYKRVEEWSGSGSCSLLVCRSCSPSRPLDYSIESFCLTSRKDIESGVCLCVSLFHRIQERKILKSRTWNEEETRISLVGVCRYREAGGGSNNARQNRTRVDSLCHQGDSKREKEKVLSRWIFFFFVSFLFFLFGRRRRSSSSKEDRNRWTSVRGEEEEREKF